jgi:hypothetical protein
LRSKNMVTTGAAPTTSGFRGSTLQRGLSSLGGGGLFGGIGDILGSLIGGGQQQAGFGDLESQIRAAMAGQGQATQQALGLLKPFQTGGAQAFQQELGALGQPGVGLPQEQDPTAFINQALSKFQQSPAQKASIQAGLEAVQNRLGAQGLGGSGAEQEALEQFAQQQTGAQQQQFLQNVLGEQARQQALGGLQLQQRGQTLGALRGLAGLGLGGAQTGAQTILGGQQNIADLLESLGSTQLAAQQARAQQTQQTTGGIGGILGGISSLLGSL